MQTDKLKARLGIYVKLVDAGIEPNRALNFAIRKPSAATYWLTRRDQATKELDTLAGQEWTALHKEQAGGGPTDVEQRKPLPGSAKSGCAEPSPVRLDTE